MTERPFWSRGVAFLIDALVLGGGVGMALIFFAKDSLASLGGAAPVVGWTIASAYFGISVALYGQTLGQAVMLLRVVACDGKKLSFARSLGRGAMLSFGYTMNGFGGRWGFWVAPLVALVTLPQIYLVLFNKTSGQLWHDVWFKSGVHRDKIPDAVQCPPLSRLHKILLGVICAAALGGGVWQAAGKLNPLLRALIGEDDIDGASYSSTYSGWYTFGKHPTQHRQTFIVTVHTPTEPPDTLANSVATKAMEEMQSAKDADKLVVNLSWGLNLGIASYSHTKVVAHTPLEWMTGRK